MQAEALHRQETKSTRHRRWAVLLLAGCMVTLCQAEPIQQRLANGLIANADYHRGPGNNAVLVLHGFLATHHFPTIQSITEELRDNGYTVLAPTLTLGISNRTTSLPCSALHLHTMEDTVQELGWWVNWLAAQGYSNISLIGHSSGSVQVLAYSLNQPHPAVHRLILTSLVSLERLPGTNPEGATEAQARQWLAAGDKHIAKYDVSFCQGNFSSPPEVFLSYHQWDQPRISEALRETRLPTTVIMGGKDQRFTGTAWMPRLQHSAPRLLILPGANHFFGGMAEFALLESILAELQREPPAPNRN